MEEDIAERLRRENPEQFLILVRMHLSFIIDMNTDENDSPTDKPKSFKWGFAKKNKNIGESGFKNSNGPTKNTEILLLTEENVNQIYQLIDVLSINENLSQEGIFRRTGSLSRQQLLRKFLSDGGILNNKTSEQEQSFSVHDMASVLKGMLADTSEPLLLNQHYHSYCHIAATCFTENQMMKNCESRLSGALKLLLLLLPPLSRRLANRLLLLLHKAASNEDSNRMSPSALATMFTPHVMCPRRLSPEGLHTDSQALSPILSFMIANAPDLFITPPQLATDINAYFTRRQQRRLMSPKGEDLNDSISERTAANTVFTFVDRQMSSTGELAGNQNNDKSHSSTTFTDAALAQLYAHIQALPESQNKRRLIKQFNRENGHGTPLQLQRAQKQKSIGHSLKKHIFNKSLMSKTLKKSSLINDQGFGYQSIIESPSVTNNYQKNDLDPCTDTNVTEKLEKPDHVDLDTNAEVDNDVENECKVDNVSTNQNCSNEITTTPIINRKPFESKMLLTSTPHVTNILMHSDSVGNCSTPIFTKNHIVRRGSMSPITKSTQKMPRAMQESIMTPRSRKPVIIKCDLMASSQHCNQEQLTVTNDMSNSSNTSQSLSSSSSSIRNDSDFVSTDESCPSKSYCIKYKRIDDSSKGFSSLHLPDMSDNELTGKKKILKKDFRVINLDQSDSDIVSNKLLEISEKGECSLPNKTKQTSLTDPFRQYLLCRSVLAGSPVDLSFVSESDDYSDVNINNIENLSSNKISSSLLYCLDGNKPSDLSDLTESSDQEMLLTNVCDKIKYKDNARSNLDKNNDEIIITCNDKENISPRNKRSLHVAVQNCDYDGGEIKRAILSKYEAKKGCNFNESEQENNSMMNRDKFWNVDGHCILRETDL